MTDFVALEGAVRRLTDAKAVQLAAWHDLVAARKLLADCELAYNGATCRHNECETSVARIAGINNRGIQRKLELQHARYTKSDVRV